MGLYFELIESDKRAAYFAYAATSVYFIFLIISIISYYRLNKLKLQKASYRYFIIVLVVKLCSLFFFFGYQSIDEIYSKYLVNITSNFLDLISKILMFTLGFLISIGWKTSPLYPYRKNRFFSFCTKLPYYVCLFFILLLVILYFIPSASYHDNYFYFEPVKFSIYVFLGVLGLVCISVILWHKDQTPSRVLFYFIFTGITFFWFGVTMLVSDDMKFFTTNNQNPHNNYNYTFIALHSWDILYYIFYLILFRATRTNRNIQITLKPSKKIILSKNDIKDSQNINNNNNNNNSNKINDKNEPIDKIELKDQYVI